MRILRKFLLLLNSLYGYLIKLSIDLKLLGVPKLCTDNACCVVVSLTSYGRRVKDNVVYYTIISILRQKIQPKRIVLWLSKEEWNDISLPCKLRCLKDKGVEIYYCQDIRSYKKLIPSLKIFPTDYIMTVDDDVIYSSDMIKCAITEMQKHPMDILCFKALNPILENGIPQNYDKWQHVTLYVANNILFPIGVGGILYPPFSLHSDVIKSELFESLCPLADDIWFWFNSIQNNTIKRYIIKKGIDYSFDALYQYFHKGSALTHSNRIEQQNDIQFTELFNYYNSTLSKEGKLISRSLK